MPKKELEQLEKLLVKFRNSDNIGLGEMEQLDYIDGLISWIHELVIEEIIE